MIRNRSRGFTLVELMLVVAVIGILASLALPPYQNYIKSARVAEAFTLSQPIRQAVADYFSYSGRFPRDNGVAGLIEPERISGRQVTAIEVSDGAIHVRVDLDQDTQGLVTLQPAIAVEYPPTELLGWVCGYAPPLNGTQTYGENRTDIPEHLLPPVCRSSFVLE